MHSNYSTVNFILYIIVLYYKRQFTNSAIFTSTCLHHSVSWQLLAILTSSWREGIDASTKPLSLPISWVGEHCHHPPWRAIRKAAQGKVQPVLTCTLCAPKKVKFGWCVNVFCGLKLVGHPRKTCHDKSHYLIQSFLISWTLQVYGSSILWLLSVTRHIFLGTNHPCQSS